MPTSKPQGKSRVRTNPKAKGRIGSKTAVGTTSSGPSHPSADSELAAHAADQQALAEGTAYNVAKASEYGVRFGSAPPEGPHVPMPSPTAGAGTLSEKEGSPKTGAATREPQSLSGSLEAKRVNSSRSGAHHKPGCAGLEQSGLAEGGSTRSDAP